MPNIQQPEMRRSAETRLVQDSDGPRPGDRPRPSREHRTVPAEQLSPYGPGTGRAAVSVEPAGRRADGD